MSQPLWRSRPDAFSMLPATNVRQKRVADGIYLSEGYSNTFLVTTPEGRVVINTGMGFEAPLHKRYFDAIDASPIRYVVLTQGHVDHVGGVDHFKQPGTLVVAQANNAEHQSYDARLAPFRQRRSSFAFAQAFKLAAGSGAAPPPTQSQPKPDVLFRERFHFALGGVDFELVACNGAETRDSLVAWLPQRRVLFAGNVFGALFGHFPNLVTIRGDRYRDALEYVATLEMLLGFDAELLCVGHHDPVMGRDAIREEIARMRDATLYVHDEIVRRMNAGGDVWSAMREIRLPPALEVGEGYGRVPWSARAIWEQYQGWFHGRSTTELYATPHWTVSPELVALAGGPARVAEAALEKAESAPVEALHLAEAALAADASHPGALRASLAAHRTLLRGTTNFWETRWLEHQIATLEAKLGEAR